MEEKNEVKSGRGVCVRVCVCARAHMTAFLWDFVCLCADKDLETGLSVPGSPSIITVNGLHMGPASTGYSNIPVYSNVRVEYFS